MITQRNIIMNNKLILLVMLLINVILANYSYGKSMINQTSNNKYEDTTVILGNRSIVEQHGGTAVGAKTKVSGINATAIGSNSHAETAKSVALGAFSVANRSLDTMFEAFSNMNINSAGEVSIGNDNDNELSRQITHVAGGIYDTDAVNIRQLRAIDNKINNIKNDIDQNKTGIKTSLTKVQQYETIASTYAKNAKTALDTISDHESKAKTSLNNTQQYAADFKTTVEATKNFAQLTNSSAHKAQALVGQLKNEISHINRIVKQEPDGVIYIAHDSEGDTVSITGKQEDRVLTGVANGVRNHDAANISQLNHVNRITTIAHTMIHKNTSKIITLEHELYKTNKKIDLGLATSTALIGLFQPYNIGKVNITVGIGGYNTSTAIAIGTGYRFNELSAIKAGVAYSEDSNLMYNTSLNLEW
ncbi:YadA-like family protein [Candidatus Fukatsuia anoeciicola]|uniref:YadA C-terminal domain-containing protein n=1 Tax=Candidatus Fukatsuia anoeciicola TaxID=2994492 RepID=UPI003463AA38